MRIISRGSCHKIVAWHGYPAYESEMDGKLIPSSIDDHAQKPPQAQLSVEVLRQMCDLDGSTGVPPETMGQGAQTKGSTCVLEFPHGSISISER